MEPAACRTRELSAKRRTVVGLILGSAGLIAALIGIVEAGGKVQPQVPAAYSVRLIRASNQEKPSRVFPVEERLRTQISRAFQWQQLWEVNRQRVSPRAEEVTRLRLSPECEVEIESVSPQIRETRIYIKGVLASRVRQNVQRHAPIINGVSMDESGAWFVAVEDESDPLSQSRSDHSLSSR